MKYGFFLLLLVVMGSGCGPGGKDANEATLDAGPMAYPNPAAPGFDAAHSDAKAVEIADSVMQAMGGRKAWDEARYFHWNFFGRRSLLWDKQAGRVKITMLPDSSTAMVLDLNTGEGQARRNGQLVENPDSLAALLGQGRSIWINDSYWLFMPFKLKDSGVQLTYIGTDTTQAGAKAHLLQLTFEEVGDTPQNKYWVWVGKEDHLVQQWAYFPDAADKSPAFVMPWQDYQDYNGLRLSGNRGEREITGIEVLGNLPDESFRLE